MGDITTQANSAWRDYETEGDEASGAHDLVKSEARAVFETIDETIADLSASRYLGKADLAALEADVSQSNGTLAIVDGDPTIWRWDDSLVEWVDTGLTVEPEAVTQAQAEAGEMLTGGMPPLRVAQAIAAAPVNTATADRLKTVKIRNVFYNGVFENDSEGVNPRSTQASAFTTERKAVDVAALNALGIYYGLDLSAVTSANRMYKHLLSGADMAKALIGQQFICGVLVYNDAAFADVTDYRVQPWWSVGSTASKATDASPAYASNQYIEVGDSGTMRYYYATVELKTPPEDVDGLMFGQQLREGGSGTFIVTNLGCGFSDAPISIENFDYLDFDSWRHGRDRMASARDRLTALERSISGEVSYATADWLALVCDSYGQGAGDLADQSLASLLALFLEYPIVNLSKGGLTAPDQLYRLQSNTPGQYHATLTPQDYPVRYAYISLGQNDAKEVRDLAAFKRHLVDLFQAAAGLGGKVLAAQDFNDSEEATSTNYGAQGAISGWVTAVREAARQAGAEFLDIVPDTMAFRSGSPYASGEIYGDFWTSGHPGTRANALIFNALYGRLSALLPPPRKFVRVMRLREGYSPTSITNVMWADPWQQAQRLQPIRTGHHALTDAAAKYFDELVTSSGSIAIEAKAGEVDKLLAGETITVEDYAVVQFGVDAVDCATIEIQCEFSETVTCKVWDMLGGTPVDPVKYQRAEPSAGASLSGIQIDDVYQAADGDFTGDPVNFTVVHADSTTGEFILNPDGAETWVQAYNTSTSGTLTRVSGSGSASVAYDYMGSGYPKAHYDNAGEPVGGWSAVIDADADGVWRISSAARYFRGRHVAVIFEKAGGGEFDMGPPVLRYTGGRPIEPEPLRSADYPRTTGSELLDQTLFDETSISDWTVVGGAGAVADDDPWFATTTAGNFKALPLGVDGVLHLDSDEYAEIDITLDNSTAETVRFNRRVVIEIAAGWLPPKFDSSDTWPDDSPITPGALGLGEIEVTLGSGSGMVPIVLPALRLITPQRIETVLPRNITASKLRITAKSDDIYLARASMKAAL
ncbi:SGNH/GDSL hydrolase family protein [Maricaulis sp.]|uniref:SGNH/GDSL hydrolase family protein n=1 Tax=Maricaulis sp. TaxID=1486257 RepID=UPI003A915068